MKVTHQRLSIGIAVLGICSADGGARLANAEVVFSSDLAGNLLGVSVDVASRPVILAQPRMRTGQISGSASFSVVAAGSRTLAYEWRRGGAAIPGATGATLFLTNLAAGEFASYTVVVSNGAGSVESEPAQLILDSDDDHLGDEWETAHFGNLAAEHGGGDVDGDGVLNEDEFADGTDPTGAASHYFQLTVAATKGGVVTVQPVQTRYAPGSAVTLTAVPASGAQLLAWSGDASGSANPLTLTMDRHRRITASFGVSLAEALDAPNLTWTTSGSGTWRGLLSGSHDGVDGAEAAPLGRGQSSRLEAVMTGQGKLRFWMKLIAPDFSPGNADSFSMRVDEQEYFRMTGEAGWAFPSPRDRYVPAGGHTLRFIYEKDPNVDTSSVAAVDEVSYTPLIPADNMTQLWYPVPGKDGFSTATAIYEATVIHGADGNFYGTNSSALFKLTSSGVFTLLASGLSQPTGVMQGRGGDLYGTTASASPAPTIFKATTAGAITVLHTFTQANGTSPNGGLVEDAAGTLYGTALAGGANNKGTIFKRTAAGVFTKLHDFAGTDGELPRTGLTFGTDGNLYGVTETGGASGNGVVFKITPAGIFTLLHPLAAGGGRPEGVLVAGTGGDFYGTTDGGTGKDAFFKVTPAGQFTIVHAFTSQEGTPRGGLTLHPDGNFYGISRGGFGVTPLLYRISPAGEFTLLHTFTGLEDGYTAASTPLANATDGRLYGFTLNGANGAGAFYRINPSADVYGAWRDGNWPPGTSDAIAGPLANPDADGFVNLLEYALGFDPNLKSALPAPRIIPWDDESPVTFIYEFRRPVGRSDVSVRGQMSTNLVTWSSATGDVYFAVRNNGDGTETVSIGIPFTGAKRFLRIEATK
jgi:uncharacterized repeat protein (TIGR03803 family)